MTAAVIGATGQQGAAVVDALLALGIPVRALVRNPRGDRALALATRGVQVVRADLNDVNSVRRGFDGADAAFAMTTFAGPGGTEGEVGQGRVITEAAESSGLPALVYSSVGGAERHTGIPHFESKRRIEEAMVEAGLPVRFLRPTFFMENLSRVIKRDEHGVSVTMPLPDAIPLQMISVRDIGKAAAAMISAGDAAPRTLEIAGDELTGTQIAKKVGAHYGVPATYTAVPLDVLGADEDRKTMFGWFTRLPSYQADFAATRALVPDVEDLSAWIGRDR
jgi:uncharacterized protein YbjT (DUF2867 family)